MRALILRALIGSSSAALAQPSSLPQVTVGGLDGSATLRFAEGRYFGGNGVTPTMQRHKLEQAIALRDEVAALRLRDGGELSAKHVAYVRRRSNQIRFGRTHYVPTGSLITSR